MKLQFPTARAFAPLLKPARYKGAWGGRGGGKDHFFGGQLVKDSILNRGLLSVCIREVQRTLAQSSKRLIESKIQQFGLTDQFKVFRDVIETPGDGIIIFQGMQDHTADSIKSLEGFKRAWWNEAQTATANSLALLRPTMRADDSQLWFSWNPKYPYNKERPEDSVDGLLRGPMPPPRSITVEAQFWDNPWLPQSLIEEEEYDRGRRSPEDYAHIWKGAYQTRSEARVFKNWKVAHFYQQVGGPQPTYRFGGDFGFAADPTVLVRSFIGRWFNNDPNSGIAVPDDSGRVLFVEYEAYRLHCDVDHTPALFGGNCPFPPTDARHWKNPYGDTGIPEAMAWPLVCDSARPETISYLQRHGFPRTEGARKGAGSVEEGVEFLKAYDIVVHPRCVHTADELTYYSFKTDPKNPAVILPVLEDKKNHVIDALRYSVEGVLRPRGFFS